MITQLARQAKRVVASNPRQQRPEEQPLASKDPRLNESISTYYYLCEVRRASSRVGSAREKIFYWIGTVNF